MWDPPSLEQQNGPIVTYTIVIVTAETAESLQFTTVDTNIILDSLMPYTTYEWTVAAHTTAGMGPFSSPATVRTSPDGKWVFLVFYHAG